MKKVPKHVEGVLVESSGELLRLAGEVWVTLVPENEMDLRVWEFGLVSGRLLQTV